MLTYSHIEKCFSNELQFFSAYWSYECQEDVHKCRRVELVDGQIPLSLAVCRIFCGVDAGTLWPRVNGKISLRAPMFHLNPKDIHFEFLNKANPNDQFWLLNEQRFRDQIFRKCSPSYNSTDDGIPLTITIDVKDENTNLGLTTNEHYQIQTKTQTQQQTVIAANIRAESIFGARHALETISQLIVFDDIRNELQMVGDFEVDDRPAFPHRGFALDTVRNYYGINSIKRTIGK